ncbi:hypothetical protein [Methylobacterium sp. J-090]|uniref:hypothetical protein n=1 Tax=Methylobacterium sp. J-090 TaxID=2836666 RepID=UPI001FB90F71|nr:hypothetical protein [Methylobacterium sp. J-090]MCJ2080720.1 hypothetical protein [Methylobacterium sp. J-090]
MSVADPVLNAIAHHRQAWDAFQIAPEGEDSLNACCEMQDALDAVLATPCATRPGVAALVEHLRWWLAEEAEFAADYQPDYGRAEARIAEIVMLTGGAASGLDMADPIFAVLDAANNAEMAHTLACETLDEDDDASTRRCNAAADHAHQAWQELDRTPPTTLGGLRALVCHYVRLGESMAESAFLHIARSLEGCDPALDLRSLGRPA